MGSYYRSSVAWFGCYGVILASTVLLDQWSKGGVLSPLNTGVAFGWGNGLFAPWLMSGVTVFLLTTTAYLWRSYWADVWWSHALFSGAALGNLLDRWRWGGVRDPWVIPVFNLHNNLADWVLVLIALYWVWYLYTNARPFSDHSHLV